MSWLVREASVKDFPFIIELGVNNILRSISSLRGRVNLKKVKEVHRRDLELIRDRNSQFPCSYTFVIEEKEKKKFVGYLIMATDCIESSTGERQAWIFDFAILEDYWQTEAPALLLKRAEEVALRDGVKYISLQLCAEDKEALEFFYKRNYLEERKRMLKVINELQHKEESKK